MDERTISTLRKAFADVANHEREALQRVVEERLRGVAEDRKATKEDREYMESRHTYVLQKLAEFEARLVRLENNNQGSMPPLPGFPFPIQPYTPPFPIQPYTPPFTVTCGSVPDATGS